MRRSYSYKPGDIFEVVLENDQSGYFQYLTRDCTQLNAEVIRIFSNRYSKNELPAIHEVVNSKVQRYTHTSIGAGEKFRHWKKVGNIPIEEKFQMPYFRTSRDIGDKSIEVSKNWDVWKVNQKAMFVGELSEEQVHFEIGGVRPPSDVVHIMEFGKSRFLYPKPEFIAPERKEA